MNRAGLLVCFFVLSGCGGAADSAHDRDGGADVGHAATADLTAPPDAAPADMASADVAPPDHGPPDLAHPEHAPSDLALGASDLASATHSPPADLANATSPAAPDGFVLSFPDGGAAVRGCEQCLEADCGAALAACDADPNCVATIDCTIDSGCLAQGASAQSVSDCIATCVGAQSLTFKQAALVTAELTAVSQCAGPCAASCGGQ